MPKGTFVDDGNMCIFCDAVHFDPNDNTNVLAYPSYAGIDGPGVVIQCASPEAAQRCRKEIADAMKYGASSVEVKL